MFEIIKPGTRYDFLGKSKQLFAISALLMLLSIGAMVTRTVVDGSPLNYGIDFTGGTEIQLSFKDHVPTEQVRQAMSAQGFTPEVQSIDTGGDTFDYLVRIRQQVNVIDQDRASKLHQAILAKKEQIGGEVKLDLASAGDRIYLRFERNPNRDELQEVFDEQGIEVVQLEQTGRPQDNAFTVHLEELQAKIGAYFKQSFGEKFSEVARVQVVGPKAGEALRNDGILAICVSLLLIVLYVAIRFDFRFSVGALAALFHDPIIILGCFSAFGWEFSLTAIAALLTVIGYSVNDTIIVFDRIREAFGFSRDKDVAKTANQAINETLSRTILTSGTTMLVVLALYFFGGSLLREFTLSLMIGIIVGTYSSIGVASAIMIQMDRVMPRLQALFAGGKQQRAGAGAAAAGSSRRISLGKNS